MTRVDELAESFGRTVKGLLYVAAFLALMAASEYATAPAQRVIDYDPALTPHRAHTRAFCLEAPTCARLASLTRETRR